ncbi:MAG: TonB-dependent receptor [Bacteroidaceae bacterium]|nr:TonB-dependent receptor [Bacteroidaceae bacterium]
MKRVLLSLLWLPLAVCAAAQDSLSYKLDEIVVSASRWCRESQAQPVKVARLSFDEANVFNPQTAADVLGLTGEVFVQKSQYGGGSPMIRGFATNRLLYSVDGVRMNTAIFRSGNIQNVISLDPFAIAGSEVLFGPGAVSYGSDAIGGVMLFSTLKPRLSASKKPVVYGSATIRTATASDELTAHIDAGVGWRRWALLTSLSYSSFADLEQGAHGPDDYIMPYVVVPGFGEDGAVEDRVIDNVDKRKQTPSGYSQFNFMQKVRYAPGRGWNFEYTFHLSETSEYARYDRHQRLKNGLPRYAQWSYGPQFWMMNHLRVELVGENVVYDSMRVNLALQRFEESRISRDFNKPRRETQSEAVDAWSANVDFIKSVTDGLTVSYGAEYVQNNVRSTGVATDVVTGASESMQARYPNAEWYSAGLYAQGEWHVTDRLNLAVGVRYNHYFIDNDFSTVGYEIPFESRQKSSAGSVSGNIGLNWRPSSGWLFRLNYARGFRAPNVDDMGKLFDSADGCVTVPNPALKPEYADNVEFGFAKHIGSFLKFDVTAYYTNLTDAIVRRDFLFNGGPTMEYQGSECRVQALQNAATANVWGVQAAVDANFAKWFYANARVSWQRGFEEMDNGDVSPSRHAAPLFGRAAVGFSNERLTIEAFTAFQAERSAADMPVEESEKREIYALDADGNAYSPAWFILNLRVSLLLARGFSLNATLENITDRRYRPYSSGISAPGRNVTMSLMYRF